jgi:hypothetical protein
MDLRIGDAGLIWQEQARPDVREQHPSLWVTGFIFDLDLSRFLYAIRSGELGLSAKFDLLPEMQVRFSIAPGVTANCLAAAAGL